MRDASVFARVTCARAALLTVKAGGFVNPSEAAAANWRGMSLAPTLGTMSARQVASITIVAISALLFTAAPVRAQDSCVDTSSAIESPTADNNATADAPVAEFSPGKRPSWFLPIHLFSIAVQGVDARSTFAVLHHRGLESNQLYTQMTGNKAALLAVKASVAAAVVYATDRISRHHRVGAVVTAAAINSAFLTAAANNFRSVRTAEARLGR